MRRDGLSEDILAYWSVQPPFLANDDHEFGSIDWYRSISEHRYSVVPYMYNVVDFPKYKGLRVLEIGCGAGTDLAEFSRFGAFVVGVDITQTAVDLSRRRLAVEGLSGTVRRYDGHSLPLEDASFDAVYSWGVIHHSRNCAEMFSEIHRVLKPGGEFVFMLYHKNSLLYYYSILYRSIVERGLADLDREALVSRFSEFREGCPYTRVFGIDEIEKLLWFFKEKEIWTEYCVFDVGTLRKIPVKDEIKVEKTGVEDIDAFFDAFNREVRTGGDLRPFGWHLIGKVRK